MPADADVFCPDRKHVVSRVQSYNDIIKSVHGLHGYLLLKLLVCVVRMHVLSDYREQLRSASGF